MVVAIIVLALVVVGEVVVIAYGCKEYVVTCSTGTTTIQKGFLQDVAKRVHSRRLFIPMTPQTPQAQPRTPQDAKDAKRKGKRNGASTPL